MSDLREARERAGLSLDEVSAKTKIPVKWLQALESGNTAAFPPGPFLSGYTRQYRGLLGLGDAPVLPPTPASATAVAARPARVSASSRGEADRPEHTETTSTSPRHRVRRWSRTAVAGVAAAGAVITAVLLSRVMRGEPADGLGVPPDQVLLVTSASGTAARVTADGRPVHDGKLPAGKQVKFAAHDRLEVELDELKGVTLVYNGSTLRPLGAQSRPRRMVFEDDRGG